ncbi:MAG: glutathione S-transferase family protein [Acidobacteria bacterium]|nr:MAG: glutathione S-transferase family protein [Acidobacteriota bacterium]
MHLFDSMLSGNCYKVRLLLAQLGLSYRKTEIDVLSSDERPAEFLVRHPNGKVPLLELDDGRCLAESNAILWFLADGTSLLPDDPFARTQVLQWMFFEQNSHEPNIAVARHLVALSADPERYRNIVPYLQQRGTRALQVMDDHLQKHRFFVGETYSIADIALYAYTHVAPEGGFELAHLAAVCGWLERVRQQPEHVPLEGAGATGEEDA